MKDIKKQFPIFQNRQLIYLDSAATSQKPVMVLDAVRAYYESYNANIHRGLYPIAEQATKKVEEVRQKVAKFINARRPEEIIFTKSATEAVNLVMYTWGRENIDQGDIVVTTIMEHHSNFVPWQQLAKEKGAKFHVLDMDENSQISILNFQANINFKKTKIIAITYISNMLGTINPLKELIATVRKENPEIVVIVDAAQAVPHKPVDVQALDCDFLVFSGHKMLAETGIGVLYAKKELLEAMPPFLYGGDMIREVAIEKTTFAGLPNKFEAGTINIAGIVSLGAAIDFLNAIGMDRIQEHEKTLTKYCMEALQNVDGITVFGPRDLLARSGVVSFTIDGIHPHDAAQILGDMNICVRSGHHCTMPLHTRLGVPASTRASFYIYNDEQDIDAFISGIKKVKKIFQSK
ncbi:MAG: cysteine desulfurase [Candidatus Levybacteria bacterium]|nr:cysteine desulfurase [Candidatus Levybacteria bacterium]